MPHRRNSSAMSGPVAGLPALGWRQSAQVQVGGVRAKRKLLAGIGNTVDKSASGDRHKRGRLHGGASATGGGGAQVHNLPAPLPLFEPLLVAFTHKVAVVGKDGPTGEWVPCTILQTYENTPTQGAPADGAAKKRAEAMNVAAQLSAAARNAASSTADGGAGKREDTGAKVGDGGEEEKQEPFIVEDIVLVNGQRVCGVPAIYVRPARCFIEIPPFLGAGPPRDVGAAETGTRAPAPSAAPRGLSIFTFKQLCMHAWSGGATQHWAVFMVFGCGVDITALCKRCVRLCDSLLVPESCVVLSVAATLLLAEAAQGAQKSASGRIAHADVRATAPPKWGSSGAGALSASAGQSSKGGSPRRGIPSRGAARRSGARKSFYKCRHCGQPKKGHVCTMSTPQHRSLSPPQGLTHRVPQRKLAKAPKRTQTPQEASSGERGGTSRGVTPGHQSTLPQDPNVPVSLPTKRVAGAPGLAVQAASSQAATGTGASDDGQTAHTHDAASLANSSAARS